MPVVVNVMVKYCPLLRFPLSNDDAPEGSLVEVTVCVFDPVWSHRTVWPELIVTVASSFRFPAGSTNASSSILNTTSAAGGGVGGGGGGGGGLLLVGLLLVQPNTAINEHTLVRKTLRFT